MSFNKLKALKILREYLEAQQNYWKRPRKININNHNEYEKQTTPYYNKITENDRSFRMMQFPKLSSIPNYGELMTLTEFIECVNEGAFIDRDGYGNYSDGINRADIYIYPSDVKHNSVRKDFSHVIWFNK